jgi:hypothetical protein
VGRGDLSEELLDPDRLGMQTQRARVRLRQVLERSR